jgi:hypothetical protein
VGGGPRGPAAEGAARGFGRGQPTTTPRLYTIQPFRTVHPQAHHVRPSVPHLRQDLTQRHAFQYRYYYALRRP